MKNYRFLLMLFFAVSSLMYVSDFVSISTVAVSGIMILLIFMVVVKRIETISVNIKLMVLFYLFIASSGISGLVNMDIELIKSTLNFVVVYISLVTILPNLLEAPTRSVTNAYLIGGVLPIVGIPIIRSGFDTTPYRGIFGNPNAMGLIAATAFSVVFSVALHYLLLYLQESKRVKKKILFFSLGSSAFLLYITLLTASRTSVLTCGLVCLMGLMLVLKNILLDFKKHRNLYFKLVLGILLVFLVSLLFPLKETFQENILSKFQTHSYDTLNGRGAAWAQTISEAKFFGRGSSYFSDHTSITAHNTYINVLGRFGWIPLFFFLAFLVRASLECYKYSKIDVHQTRFVPGFVVLSFLVLSIGESIMFNLGMFLMFAMIGAVSASNSRESEIGAQPLKAILDRREQQGPRKSA